MKTLFLDGDRLIAERRLLGLDHLDEVWEGVYHIVPPPNSTHQEIVDLLLAHILPYLKRHGLGTLRSQAGVCTWPEPQHNYRVPDLTFVRSGREEIFDPESPWLRGAPDAVIEVHSPGDETYEKIPFFESIGVGEMLIIHRDTKAVEMLRLVYGRLRAVSADADGWFRSDGLRVSLRTAPGGAKLELLLEQDGPASAPILVP